MTTTREETCSYCQGLGTVGGSFPGIMGTFVPGETCPICHGTGKVQRVTLKTPVTPPKSPEPLFEDVVREITKEMHVEEDPPRHIYDARKTESLLILHKAEVRRPPWDVPMPASSLRRMQDVVDYAYLLANARESYRRGRIHADALALWQLHYQRAVRFYTDPFGSKVYA